MKIEQAISNAEYELCLLLEPENEAEKELMKLVDVSKGYFIWYDNRIALRTKFQMKGQP